MNIYKLHITSIKAVLFGAALLFSACEENVMDSFGEINRNFADRVTQNAHVIQKDSGKLKMELKAPLIEEFTLIDSTFTVMKKGVDIKFWNANKDKPNLIRADWAKIIDKKKLYEAKENVVIINNDGDTLLTNHIFWDNLNKRIFTKDTVTIIRIDGTKNIAKNGLEASEDLKEITLYNNHGVIMYQEDSVKGNVSKGKISDSKNPKKIIMESPKQMDNKMNILEQNTQN